MEQQARLTGKRRTMPRPPRRTRSDVLLLGVTSAELALLCLLTPTFSAVDWIYLSQHLLVLGIALTRHPPRAQDHSLPSTAAVVVAYAYPYAQMAYLRWVPGDAAWPAGGLVLVMLAAGLSVASLVTLGRRFGVRPAWRGLALSGPYRFVRHPMYLSYVLADVGYNLKECNAGTVLLVLAGWTALAYRIHAEERVLSHDAGWARYRSAVRSRLIPGVW
jgi:protein-S-isoprenylcysteine O-methyltransferase Ste14